MTHKDKVKELVGRGLHSYHTKALQQMDRIEKKNKEQNHKISILTNELDNDYLTKSEEGSVISLEHSKEGMVYLDELQGNTLVNYCTDGSKELTLNGDIDLEGTFVTTTEGVDNGKVDVMCEGNTLVNLWVNSKETSSFFMDTKYGWSYDGNYISGNSGWCCSQNNLNMYKPNTLYTIIVNVKHIDSGYLYINNGNAAGVFPDSKITVSETGTHTFTMTSKDNIDDLVFAMRSHYTPDGDSGYIKFNMIILEGDWTEKEIPTEFFEGMKSVGQDDENGHKIEILSNNSLIRPKYFKENYYVSHLNQSIFVLKFIGKPNTSYTMSTNHTKTTNNYDFFFNLDDVASSASNGVQNGEPRTVTTSTDGIMYIMLRSTVYNDFLNGTYHIYLQETSKSTSYKFNKKEILLNEPLRGLPNGVKDRFVKIGGKRYIERNCKEVVFLEEYIDHYYGNFSNIKKIHIGEDVDWNTNSMIMCDKFVYKDWGSKSPECITTYNNDTLRIYSDIYNSIDLLKGLIRDKGIKMVFKLLTPTYEPLEIEPTLNTYNDTTHISNDSLIPCNMKVQNSGYNAIIKPSTLYTVALDTNISETIGMNLGGVKGTTTNNVLKLTTPATLTDDSLRLYGKGIKGSKVRLLEGDKTNWIPSHFEGMKSSFEDKVQSDGTYKMEILSNNKNLLDLDKLLNVDNYLKGTYSSIRIPLKPNTKYYFKFNFKPNNIHRWIGVFSEPLGYYGAFKKTFVWNENIDRTKQGTFITDDSTEYYLSVYQPSVSYNDNNWYKELFTNVYEDFIISQVDDNYIEGKSNKIQFSSIEPLRGIGDIKDKFVFVDGQLMIERNIKTSIIDGTEGVVEIHGGNKCMITKFVSVMNKGIDYIPISCDKLQVYAGRDIMVNAQNVNGVCYYYEPSGSRGDSIVIRNNLINQTVDSYKEFLLHNPLVLNYIIKEPTYEEIPFELQKIILEGYENGTLFFDTNIPPTSTVTYAGETPIVKSVKLNKTEVLNNTNDINDNIIPYLMDMDYRVVCLQLQSEEFNDGVSMTRLFGGAYEMLQRDIQSKRYSVDEYRHRLDAYLGANKITEEEYNKLGDMLNE